MDNRVELVPANDKIVSGQVSDDLGPAGQWLLRQKVMLPDPVEGFVERTSPGAHCDPMKWRVTAIHAPGGFGKTTLLAEACRRSRKHGTVVAWLTVDEDDGPKTLATYLAFAFSQAGLDILDPQAVSRDFDRGDYRINLLLNSIDAHGADCVLALDDIHRLRDPGSLGIVNRLLQHAPTNLHLALAFRYIPDGLDVATPIFQGRGTTVTTEELRFRKPEIARFFATTLSRTELANLTESSQGWPIALCIHRNVREQTASDVLAHDIASNWIDTRLWSGLSSDDQDFILDIGLFEWINVELVDEVLGVGSVRRIGSIPALAGLLQSVGDNSGTLHMHPLLRQHCASRRFRETPDRYRSLHRAIAEVLARQGHVVAGMRHAGEADEPRLVGRIIENAGGFRVWFEHGLARLRQVAELITHDVWSVTPRAGLVRCMELTMRGQIEEAVALYVDLAARTDGFTRHPDGRDDRELDYDHLTFRYVLVNQGCRSITTPEVRSLNDRISAIAKNPPNDPFVYGAAQYAMCEIEKHRGNLDDALVWARRAYDAMRQRSWFLTMYIDMQVGNIAMIQGRVSDADKAFARARRAAKAELLEDEGPMVLAEVLSTELRLERNKPAPLSRRSHKVPLLARSGAWVDVYVAAAEAAIELAVKDNGVARALDELEEIVVFAQGVGLATLHRCLMAMRVSLLAGAGRAGEAQETWDRAGFSDQPEEIVDLDHQTWREMESISLAGLRLLTARSQYDAARELAETLLAVSRGKGLRRTEMRALGSAMVLEHRAGNPGLARRNLVDYLRNYGETDYVRPLIQDRAIAVELLESLDQEEAPSLAESLLHALSNGPHERATNGTPDLTPRELEILRQLEGSRDKEIANVLNLSEDGVRYHNKKIFHKLGVSSRLEATHRARTLGILPASADPNPQPIGSPS